jgi:23S rRNA (guanosine2251-2'-O)-methyltransferase
MKDTRAGKSDRKPWQKGPGAKRPGGHPGKHSGGRSGGSGEPGRGRQPPVARRDMPDDGIVRIFGSHAVEAALNNRNRRVIRLLATENAEIRLAEVIAARRVLIDRATPGDLDHLLGADTVHQGLLLEAQPLEEPLLAELIARAKTHGPLVLLDHVTDPHNFGAVLRSAAAFGTAGLIMTRRHSPPLNGVLAKAASGALDLVPVLPVQNLAKTMEELKAQGFRLIGLEGASDARLEDESFEGPCAVVLGAEGKGLRELTAQTCDRLVSISTGGSLHSLNVSNAAAVTLHWAAMSRRRAGA